MKNEATVTVLTAEVKTLLIGSRQVTLSIWYQLDVVPDNEITPFGRVSPPKDTSPVVWVVGKHENGSLVRSSRPLSRMGMNDYLKTLGWTGSGDDMSPPRSWLSVTLSDEMVMAKIIAEDREAYRIAIKELEGKAAQWRSLDLVVLAGLGLK